MLQWNLQISDTCGFAQKCPLYGSVRYVEAESELWKKFLSFLFFLTPCMQTSISSSRNVIKLKFVPEFPLKKGWRFIALLTDHMAGAYFVDQRTFC